VQVYCDFSGYTDMAIAVGRLLGYRLPPNFDFPFVARNPSDFWRRWHVSFSSWLRDYLFPALPGSRQYAAMRWLNTLFIMLAAGLWHGGRWTFVLWGAAHGLLLVVHDAYGTLRKKRNPGYRPATGLVATTLSIFAMQSALLVTMIFFGSRTVEQAWTAIQKLVYFDGVFAFSGMALPEIEGGRAIGLLFAFAILHLAGARFGSADGRLARAPLWATSIACILFGFATYCLWPLDEAPFIYQQF
ncbi:MAG: MBOAT family O-acyltransferase, partial [Candidatus Binatia bacterium]